MQDGGAVGSRRGDFNCVQYGVFPCSYTRRGKESVFYSPPSGCALTVTSFVTAEAVQSVLCVPTAHGKVTRGCSSSITHQNYLKKETLTIL